MKRNQQQHKAVPEALSRGMLISDYTFAKDELFAWLNLKDDELAMYGRVHSALSEKIPQPDLIVYLYADHPVIMRRTALRDRPYERDMDPAYIQELVAAYQQFHRQLDNSKGFDPDLFFNYILLTEEVGEIASELIKIWGDSKRLARDGRTAADAHQEAIGRYRAGLRNELADLLAYVLKLANYTNIDLEQAYLEKMKHNVGRDWPAERTTET